MEEESETAGLERDILLDRDPEDYRAFFLCGDGRKLSAATEGTELDRAAFELSFAWRKASDARAMTWTFVEAIPLLSTRTHPTQVLDRPSLVEDILGGIVRRMEGRVSVLPRRVKSALREVVAGCIAEVREAREEISSSPLDPQEVVKAFEGMIQSWAFCTSLVAHEAQAYAALFFAYEDFLSRAVECLTGTYPSSGWELKRDLESELGEAALERFWTCREITAAAEARHAIAHRGGRSNERTEQFADLLEIHENADGTREVIIRATRTNSLYACLLDRVLELVPLVLAKKGSPKVT